MAETYLHLLSVITIFLVNAIKSDDSVDALKKILNELNGRTKFQDDRELLYRPRHYEDGGTQKEIDPSNVMYVQMLDSFLKPNKRQREQSDTKRLLRTDIGRNCKSIGRCGCTGTRCGHPSRAEDDIADEVDKVIDDINKQAVDDGELNNYEDSDDVDDELKNERYKADADYEAINEEDRDEYENVGNSKNIKIHDDIDVVVLDKSNLDTLLKNKDFNDLTRNYVNNDDDDDENGVDKEIFQKALSELKNLVADDKPISQRSNDNTITPEYLLGNYETVKKLLVSKVLSFVKHNKLLSFVQDNHLTLNQRRKLRNIRAKYKRGEIELSDAAEEIVRIIFGAESNMKIVPQTKNKNHIYIPKWIYDKVMGIKKNLRNYNLQVDNDLRLHKRILPLTSQQMERLYNKEKGKTIPKLVWRKQLDEDIRRYGVPFDLEVHGLGQIAP